jgi:hypothetical protein
MSVILQAPLPYQTPLTDVQKKELTDYINQYRKAHQAQDLTWNNNIATFSQSWSNYLLSNNLFQHSGNQMYGENLAYFKGYGNDPMTLLKLSIDLWYKEIEYYDFSKPGFSNETGHFTCLVWKNSKTFGMGISIMDDTVVVSFNTTPPGNILGSFEENVLPKLPDVPLPQPPNVPPPSIPSGPLIPSQPVPPPEPTPSPILPNNKTMYIVSMIYNVIDEVKKPNSNKVMIIHYLKKVIKELIHHS